MNDMPVVTDENVGVRFFIKPVLNKRETEKAGAPVFDEREMCELIFPGNKFFRPHFLAHDICEEDKDGLTKTYAQKFANAYALFRQEADARQSGTPLEMLFSEGEMAELKAQNVYTVEQMAEVPDRALSRMGPNAMPRRDRARNFVQRMNGTPDMAAASGRIAELEAKLAELMAAQETPPEVQHSPARVPAAGEIDLSDRSDDDLKDIIKTHTGQRPRGTPTRDRLEELAREHL